MEETIGTCLVRLTLINPILAHQQGIQKNILFHIITTHHFHLLLYPPLHYVIKLDQLSSENI